MFVCETSNTKEEGVYEHFAGSDGRDSFNRRYWFFDTGKRPNK
jgi:hypothetical protein